MQHSGERTESSTALPVTTWRGMGQGIQHITNYRGYQHPPLDSRAHLAEDVNRFTGTAESDDGTECTLNAATVLLLTIQHEHQESWGARWNPGAQRLHPPGGRASYRPFQSVTVPCCCTHSPQISYDYSRGWTEQRHLFKWLQDSGPFPPSLPTEHSSQQRITTVLSIALLDQWGTYVRMLFND